MFEEFLGLPAHPLLVHAVVIFVPLLGLAAILYSFVPVARTHIRWVLAALAVVTPLSALFTKLAGDALFDRMDAAGAITEGFYPVLEEHGQLGTNTMWASMALGLLTLALVFLLRPQDAALYARDEPGARQPLLLALRLLTLAAAGVSLYFVLRAGDSGARAVWEHNWQQWQDAT